MMRSHLAVFLITSFFCCVFVTSDSVYTLPFPFPRDQVEILLDLKNEFPSFNCDLTWKLDYFGRMDTRANISSWTKDSNSFSGVSFDSETGVVKELSLGRQCLTSLMANSSLFRFQHLRYLDLSENHFDSSPIPSGFGRLTYLESLDLSKNGFIGEVPSSISNLSRLTNLDLSYNKLTGRIPSLHNLTLLENIDLSYNKFSGPIPAYLFTMPFLVSLNLRQNHLSDPLENINPSATSKLLILDMAYNLMSHRILEPISKLANLMRIDLSFQKTPYTFNFDFLLFKSLERLDLSGNSVSVVGTGSENLTHLELSSCNITEFPMFIKDLQRLWWLDISNNRIKGKVPELLWNLPSMLHVNLSHNSIDSLEGTPKVILNSSISELDLSSNAFKGSFPIIPPYVHIMAASNNYFTGGIPLIFCKRFRLSLLDLSNNNFSGSIPRCLTNVSLGLEALKLSNNNLTGRLPDIEDRLVLLDVGHNQISGKLPRSLVNCTSLKFLNVEGNHINDTFPFWLKALTRLEIIVLRSNRFHGPISSPEISLSFTALRIIDISRNSFNGSLPQSYFANWSAPLVNIPQGYRWPEYTGDEHSKYETPLWSYPSIHLRIKGRSIELGKIPDTYTSIDFSGNSFEGQIPESIGFLKSLIVLDLSNNSFTGRIPSSLAKLKQLESLDLSQNRISGNIPQELRDLTFLGYVNMSHNRLTGQIPQSTQIGGQPKSSFEGNINLCGLPLQESCFRGNGAPSTPQTQEQELPKQEHALNWKAAAIGYGPGVLFGLAIGQALARYKPVLFYKLFRL
ncbi:unnamed protein product [Arabidopsis lyrata]|uniref:Receptor like protein n=1 Tax=Arabidopsis lyrata subsp. lyrata TaxID=81972 RepID=D7MJB1_ARALL|nr:receptor-like protein 12 isoform X1 [Arabidopsis lyrata subsp. lyrata]EFH46979.1 hypothetical protein ARALYDRAFT_493970 [Arabidopsis lyrata subsp. lyrata]CAH8277623.1 unnamed protein product [Arabidopsis lyrata]|eukprot:XP_002870720.1 receptor-like protein 12 isoform X1 [Arabidopsis lyrata subsp. lyrata]